MNHPAFKAIVLTHDRNSSVARHMIARYESVWPDHPFTFRVPYQEQSALFDHPRCEFVQSSPGIKQTVGVLLADLPDEEWIYWCLDDKYPIRMDVPRISSITRALVDAARDEISGVLFCRPRRLLDEAHLVGGSLSLGGHTLFERRQYHRIWIHQFLRVKVIRHLFGCFPDVLEPAKIMDRLKRAVAKPTDHRLWVTDTSYAIFGESMSAGVLTENCLESMNNLGIPIPRWQPATAAPACIIGEPDLQKRP